MELARDAVRAGRSGRKGSRAAGANAAGPVEVLDRAYELESGSVRSGSMQAVMATLDPSFGNAPNGCDPGATRRTPFHLHLKLQGIGDFSVLTLASFALYELLGRLRIHPIQYLLVGVALLLGTLLLFGLLSALMVGTRRVDWFELFAQTPADAATPRRAVQHGTS